MKGLPLGMGRITRVWIDQEKCLDHEMCVSECPEVFQIVPGETVASVKPDAEKYYRSHDRDIRSAAAYCPVACIHITEADD